MPARLATRKPRSRRSFNTVPKLERPKGTSPVTTVVPARLPEIPVLSTDGLPVRGRIHHRFGDRLDNGQNAKGVSLKTRPGSTVIAPRDGLVVFAGPFRGLGKLLIIEYQAKYHLLLGGMGRIDKQVGDNVLAGEPIGTMEASKNAGSALYMELRRNGQPINPLPWLAAGRIKVNG